MPRPPVNETPDVRASKTLAYILRHGAEKEGLHIRSDGYIKLNDVLARPKMRDVDLAMVLRLVGENAKKRFEILYGYDPSPPIPKKVKKGQQPKRLKLKLEENGLLETAKVENIGIELAKASLDIAKSNDTSTAKENNSETHAVTKELPLVALALPTEDNSEEIKAKLGDIDPENVPTGEYFIRASQGHSIKLEGVLHLTEINDDEEGRKAAGFLVHGTKFELWDVIKTQGLSRMTRQHIHLAPSLSLQTHHITPRQNSSLLIYLNLQKLIEGGIKLYVSANGVLLTPGDEGGFVGREYWLKVERVSGGLEKGRRWIIWEEGRDVVEGEGGEERSEQAQLNEEKEHE